MPPLVLTEEQKAAALLRGGEDLKFLLERNDVPPDVMAKWFHIGVVTLEKFANIARMLVTLRRSSGIIWA
jgi:hypothetical protein